MKCPTCGGTGETERDATPEEVDAGHELGVAYDTCRECGGSGERPTLVRPVMVNGRWLLHLPEHRAARPEWPWWEATRLAAMKTVIGAGDVVWDVGAEEGDFPALWATWGAQVVLAEPNPAVWPNIKLVWMVNGLAKPLACWPGFLGAETSDLMEHLTIVDDAIAHRAWPASADGPVIGNHGFCQLGERPDLPTTRIDYLVEQRISPPTVLTMDVEGSELHVLRGAEATLREHRPHVFVSIHPEFMEHHYGLDAGVERVRTFMRDVGYPWHDHVYLATDHEHHWWFPREAVR